MLAFSDESTDLENWPDQIGPLYAPRVTLLNDLKPTASSRASRFMVSQELSVEGPSEKC